VEEIAGATCAEHAGLRALGACGRCGVFVCGSCGTLHDYRILCRQCLSRVSYSLPHTTRSVVAVVFGLLSLVGLLPLGIIALALGYGELRDIREGRRPAGGRWFAQAAVLFGWIALAMLTLALAVVVLAVLLGDSPAG
jgi:hypothetical protein